MVMMTSSASTTSITSETNLTHPTTCGSGRMEKWSDGAAQTTSPATPVSADDDCDENYHRSILCITDAA